MLSVPSIDRVGSVTVYGDDAVFYRFYPVAQAPRLRVGDDGDPVFLLLNYALSDEERAAHPELPAGGGYLNFDSSFEITADERAAVVERLQPLVDAEWLRLRAGTPEERAKADAAGVSEPPKVVLANPTWVGGSVRMDAPASERLVEGRVADGLPSLLTGNIASFSLDLTPAGAEFMEQSLLGDGDDPADETPIQIAYDLTFWARLPPARIHLSVDAERMHKYIEERMRGMPLNTCNGPAFDSAPVDTETLELSGAVTCQIDTGSGSLPESVITELRAYAFDLLKSIVAHSFFAVSGDETSDGGPPAPTPAPTPSGRPIRIGGRRIHAPWERFRLGSRLVRKDIDIQTMSISLVLEQRSVVPWTIHPRGTIQTLLSDNPDARRKHVRKLRLGDPFFATLKIEVEVFGDFSTPQYAEVELDYSTIDENGSPYRRSTTLIFSAPGSKAWTTPVVGGERAYRWRLRSVRSGTTAGPFGEWVSSVSPRLPLSVASPGVIEVDVVSGMIDWDNLVARVQVELAWTAEDGSLRDRSIIQLTPNALSGRYKVEHDLDSDPPAVARIRFDLRNGDVFGPGDWEPVEGGQVVVNQPSEALLTVQLQPAGTGWTDVIAVVVDLEYTDPDNAVRRSDTFILRSISEFATWRVYLHDRNRRGFRYRWTASFQDGDLIERGWTENPGDPVLPVRIDRPGIPLVIIPDALDFQSSPLTEVSVRHDVPNGAVRTFLFTERQPQTWHVAAALGAPIRFACAVTHFPPDRDPIKPTPWIETDTMIVLPPFRAIKEGELRVLVVGNLVDFAVTPLVAVDLTYSDPDNQFEADHSLMLSPDEKTSVWVLPTRDARITGFKRRITYFRNDGTPVAGEWVEEIEPRVIVPAFHAPNP